jgi:hypothetical protein
LLYRPEWKEVVLLLARILYNQGREKADELVDAILEQLGAGASLSQQAQTAGLLGAMVCDLSPYDYQPSHPGYARLMERVMAIFSRDGAAKVRAESRIKAASALGEAGDPRLG